MKKQNPDLIHCGKIDMLFIAVIYKKIINKKTSIIYEVGDLPRFINTKTGINKILTKAYMLVEKI
ncbi:hypothetical protein, partial [Bacillus subtilis]|uniref:hypothetical protein n=1 Tax=Bacillus subtilis TaxID=1423 RepID=UPI001932B98C